MSTELVYRMRTCAAALLIKKEAGDPVAADAVDLLIEASNLIDIPDELGEPMEVLQALAAQQRPTAATWGGDLPAVRPQPCPSCGDDNSARTVKRNGKRLMLTCPMCASTWEYGK